MTTKEKPWIRMDNKKYVVILETSHFQYVITQMEIFSDCYLFIITTPTLEKEILEFAPEAYKHRYISINSIKENKKKIIKFIKSFPFDLFLINPVFDDYGALNKIVRKCSFTKVITTHNINTWFNGRFWSPKSLMDRLNMRSIIRHCDYVAVEDFIYHYLKSSNHQLFHKHKFLYIPFTIFHPDRPKKFTKPDNRLRVVLPGYIDGDRRHYEDVLEMIKHFIQQSNQITFIFAGRANGEYGKMIVQKLQKIQALYPTLVSFFDDKSTPDMFRQAMETSDLVLSASNITFKGMGTTEYIGKTKPTAAIHDMITYQLPGLLPHHLLIPHNLQGSAFNYSSVDELTIVLENLLLNPSVLFEWKAKAQLNSLNYTAEIIRKGLPF